MVLSSEGRQPMPAGTVTFVLGDIEGSVRHWEAEPDAMAAASARFEAMVAEQVAAHGGARPVEQGEGDSFVAAFPVAHDAVMFAVALQRALAAESWPTAAPLRLRMALHSGSAQARPDGTYRGPALNRCARLRALAHGGQSLVSGVTAGLVADELDPQVALDDLGVHPLRDFDRPEHVYQLRHADLPQRFPPLRDDVARAGLPVLLTTLVARQDELAALAALLQRERIVTLTGAGGSGKTRLAAETARRQAPQFGAGVAWADAAPLADGALVPACVAAALGVRESPSEPIADTVARDVGDRHLLLVIDNCEHVIDDAARLVERLVAECPRLHVLATSREPLGLGGETSMQVPSLAEADAVELFVERAAAVRPGFSLAGGHEAAVAEVCRRLDGIPLAIELAAARVRVLTPQQICDGLTDRFRLLTGGSRTALPRQRTLEASVDWSYRLLSEPEQVLLDRLSVFAGGFTLDAARSVCGHAPLDGDAILDLLTALVDRSLVQVAEGRYHVLETIRHFARQRLADGGDPDRVRDHHLAHFVALADEAAPLMERGHESEWLARLDAEMGNLRAALDWADESGQSDLLVRLAGALWLFWEVRCRFDEGRRWLRRAVEAAPEPTADRARAMHGLGDISLFVLDPATVVWAAEELAAIADHLGDPAIHARSVALFGWAATYHAYRDTDWACQALTEAVAALREVDDPWVLGDVAYALGYACAEEGDLAEAAGAFDLALECATEVGSEGGIQRGLFFRGWTHALAGEVELAEPALVQAVELGDELQDTWWSAMSVTMLAYASFLRGDRALAEAHARDVMERGDRERNPVLMVLGSSALSLVLAAGDHPDAVATAEQAVVVAEEFGARWTLVWVDTATAWALARSGDIDGARQAVAHKRRGFATLPAWAGSTALARARVERLAGDDAAAESALVEAAGHLFRGGLRADTAEALEGLAVSAARRCQWERAARLFGAAGAERDRLGVVRPPWSGLPSPDPEMEATRDETGPEAWEAGAALGLDEAVALALRGRGGRRRPTSGWDSLTPTEREVVALVTEGLSNPEIAEKLLITRGTVKVHLSHVFTKLGIGSRAELAAEAVRRGA